jgi:ribokinase
MRLQDVPADLPMIVVVGSYNVGFTFRSPRLPAPGETLLGSGFSEGPGGKGSNQAVAAARLGARVRMVGRVGSDRYGADAFALWEREGVDAHHVSRAPVHTGAGVILVDDRGENSIVVAPGANDLLTPAEVDAAHAAFAGAAVVLLQLETPTDAVDRAATLARAVGARVILNPAPARPLPDVLLAKVDVLTPNHTELATLAGLAPEAPYDVRAAVAGLLARGVGSVVLTRGSAGASVATRDAWVNLPAPRVAVVDTTGAGDAFSAALAVALAEGRELVDAAEFAVRAGALAVTKPEVVPALPTRAEVEQTAGIGPSLESK